MNNIITPCDREDCRYYDNDEADGTNCLFFCPPDDDECEEFKEKIKEVEE